MIEIDIDWNVKVRFGVSRIRYQKGGWKQEVRDRKWATGNTIGHGYDIKLQDGYGKER